MKHLVFFAFCVVSTLGEDFFGNVVLPSDVSITLDEGIYIKMKTSIKQPSGAKCEYQAPGKKERNSPDFFVKFTEDGCGIKIEKVQIEHEGVWKLISTFKNATFERIVRGASIVKVKEKIVLSHDEKKIYSPKDNFAPPNVDLNYCYVSKDDGIPMKLAELDPKKCMIPQNLANDDLQNGKWTVHLGIKGVTNEISYSVNIQPTGEFLIKLS